LVEKKENLDNNSASHTFPGKHEKMKTLKYICLEMKRSKTTSLPSGNSSNLATRLSGTGRRLLLLCLGCLLLGPAMAQLSGRFHEAANLSDFPFTVTSFSTQQGMPQNQVSGIIKDPASGDLLLSTTSGIVRYDGYGIKPFYSDPLKFRYILDELYIGSNYEYAIGHCNNGDLYLLGPDPKIIGNYATVDIKPEHWASVDTAGNLQFKHHASKKNLNFKISCKEPKLINVLDTNRILVSSYTGTWLVYPSEKKEIFLTAVYFSSCTKDTTRNRHLLTSVSNIFILTANDSLEKLISLKGDEPPEFWDAEIIDDILVIASFKGIYTYIGGRLSRYSESDILPTNSILKLYYDKSSDCLFAGTGNKGFLKLQRKRFENLYEKKSSFEGSFGSIVQLDESTVLAAGRKGVLRIKGNKNISEISTGHPPLSLSRYGTDLLIGTWGYGILRVDANTGEQLDFNPLDNCNVHGTFVDSKGRLLACGNRGFLMGTDIRSLKYHLPDLINKNVVTLKESRSGELWLAYQDEVTVLDQNRQVSRRLTAADGLVCDNIRSFYEDKEGKMWIGTKGGGLYCFHGGKLIA
jgi:ligand-binding sensor domain-containing protein